LTQSLPEHELLKAIGDCLLQFDEYNKENKHPYFQDDIKQTFDVLKDIFPKWTVVSIIWLFLRFRR
jgi:hypothetical protein